MAQGRRAWDSNPRNSRSAVAKFAPAPACPIQPSLHQSRFRTVKRFFPSDRATPSKKVQRLRYKTGGKRRRGSAAQTDETVRREGTAAGQPAIRFHDSRHTAASILLARGVHVKLVSEMLRHSTIVLTLDTYSHVISAMHADAAAAMDAVFTA
jgi:integrase